MINQDDVIYMIVTDRFADGDPANNGAVDLQSPGRPHGGDLLGIVRRMPYLRELGVTALWITPVYPNPPNSYHGYHPLDFEHLEPRLCSPELGPAGEREVLRRFVEIAHEHGLKVILDVIVCHTAPGHPWLRERPEWFNPDSETIEKCWLWGLPDLNHDNLDVNEYMARNVLEWMDCGVDGVRIDAARHIEKQFWEVFKLFAHGLRPDVTLIGEVWDGDPARVAPYQALHGFESMFDFPLYHAVVDVFAHDQHFGRIARPRLSPDEPYGVLDQGGLYRNAHRLVTFLGNHDTPRFFHQACGSENPVGALARMKLALTFLLTTRGIPQLYYGDELAMPGGPHPDNRRDMPWGWLEPGAEGPEAARARDMLEFTRRLIGIRRGSCAVRSGLMTTLYVSERFYAYARSFPGDVRVIALNNAPEPVEVEVPLRPNPWLTSLTRQAFSDGVMLRDELCAERCGRIREGRFVVSLPGRTGAVYRPDA